MNQPANTIPSLSRACRVFDLLVEHPEGLSPAELAVAAPLPRATAFRVLKTLEVNGFAEQRGRVYVIGPRFTFLASKLCERDTLGTAAGPVLDQLAQDAQHTAHLVVPQGGRILVKDVRRSPNALQVVSSPGTLAWRHCSAPGKALLAAMDDGEAESLLDQAGYPEKTERTITGWAEMQRELARIRRRGYAIDDRENHTEVRCIAAAVTDHTDQAVAAIGITGPANVLTLAKVIDVAAVVQDAAADLSRILQHAHPPQPSARAEIPVGAFD